MMLRNAVSLVLFEKNVKDLNEAEVDNCNRFIDDFCKVKELI